MINKEYTTSIPIKGEEIKYVGSFTQNDINGVNRINAMLMDGMNAFDITGYTTITFSVLKPDGTICVDGQGERINVRDAENGVITIDLHNNVMDRQGTCLATLEVYEGERKLSTSRLRFVIVGDLADGADPTGESTFPALTEFLTTWSTDEAARKANELIRIANEDTRIANELQRIANELQRIANEGVNAQNIQIINQILTTKADKATSLAGYDIRDAYTKKQIDEIIGILDPDGVNDIIGSLPNLLTIYKKNIVGAINEVFISGSSFKADVATAITTKGVPTAPAASKDVFVANILAIKSGGNDFMQIQTEQLTLYSVAKLTKVV